MLNRRTILFAAAIALSFSVTSTDAQPEGQAFTPIDQTVDDLDLRASSLRYVEQGIGVYGQSGSLYRRPGFDPWSVGTGQPQTQQYLFRQPGVTAWIDRPDYLVLDELGEMRMNTSPARDGRFLGLIPPNTVFDLTRPTAVNPDLRSPGSEDGWGNTRINTRIDGTINTHISGGVLGQAQGPLNRSFPPPLRAHKVPPRRPEVDDPSKQHPDESDQSSQDEPASEDSPADEPVPGNESP